MPIADRASAQRGAPLPKVRVAMPRRHVIGVDDGACGHMLDVALDAGLSLLHHASRFLEVHLCLRISTRHDAVAVVLAGAVRAMQPARDAAAHDAHTAGDVHSLFHVKCSLWSR